MHPAIGRGLAALRGQDQIFKTLAVLILGTYIFITLAHSGLLKRRLGGSASTVPPPHHRHARNLSDLLDDSQFNASMLTESSTTSSTTEQEAAAKVKYHRRYHDTSDDSSTDDTVGGGGYGTAGGGGYKDSGRYDAYDNYYRPDPTPEPPTKSPEEQVRDLAKTIQRLERNEKLNGLRDRIDELHARQKIRDHIRKEEDFQDEAEEEREREREMQRARWDSKLNRFLREREHDAAHNYGFERYHVHPRAVHQRWTRKRRGGDDDDDDARGEDEEPKVNAFAIPDVPKNWYGKKRHTQLTAHEEAEERAGGGGGGGGDDGDGEGKTEEDYSEMESCPGLVPTFPFKRYQIFKNTIAQSDMAYVTFVTSHEFVMPAAVLMHSVAVSGSQYARAVCVTPEISASDRTKLSTFAQVIEIQRVPSPLEINNDRYKDTFTKLRMWELIMFRRILYVDTDVVIIKNMDSLFDIGEWGVTMDAEQGRYSTGMMILEPKQETFDRMIEKLKTTTVSMELPDLLFLKEYFDEFHPNAKINIIPRWYQVYQEEFGSSYSSYLTSRQQKLTIFDPRIMGMHFPGGGKPWLGGFEEKYRKFSKVFCHWTQAKQMKYSSQLHWYVHYEMLQRSMLKERSRVGITFDFDAGGSVIVLTEYIKKAAEEAKKRRSSYDYYNYGNDNNKPYSPYKYGNDNPPSEGEKKWVYRDGAWKKVPVAQAADDASGSTSASGSDGDGGVKPLTYFEPNQEKLWKTNSQCFVNVGVQSALDAISAVSEGRSRQTNHSSNLGLRFGVNGFVSQSGNHSSKKDGGVSDKKALGVLNFTALKPLVFKLQQLIVTESTTGNGKVTKTEGDTYEWFLNWCSRSKIGPPTANRCGKTSYLTQYSDGECRSNFDEGLQVFPVWSSAAKKCVAKHRNGFSHQSIENRCFSPEAKPAAGTASTKKSTALSGVVFRTKVTIQGPRRIRWMEVKVRCDWSMAPNTAAVEKNTTQYPVRLVKKPHDRLYTIQLRSRCACLGGCDSVATSSASAGAGAALGDYPPEEAFFDKAFNKWRLRLGGYTFAHKCLTVGKDFSKCLDIKPGCSYDVKTKRCVAPNEDSWLRIREADEGRVCNCTHVGGSGEGRIPTLVECRAKALAQGANVINHFSTVDAPTTTAAPAAVGGKSTVAKSGAKKVKSFNGGCYFKRCSIDQIIKAQVSLTKPNTEGEKYNVEILNPFFETGKKLGLSESSSTTSGGGGTLAGSSLAQVSSSSSAEAPAKKGGNKDDKDDDADVVGNYAKAGGEYDDTYDY